MIFQGKELHIGDKLVSKRHGEVIVESMHRKFFTATPPGSGQTYEWDYEGRYCYVEDQSIDATWPDASPEQPPIQFAPNPQPRPEREAEHRRVWIEVASRIFVSSYEDNGDNIHTSLRAFEIADDFIAELKRRDEEGK